LAAEKFLLVKFFDRIKGPWVEKFIVSTRTRRGLRMWKIEELGL